MIAAHQVGELKVRLSEAQVLGDGANDLLPPVFFLGTQRLEEAEQSADTDASQRGLHCERPVDTDADRVFGDPVRGEIARCFTIPGFTGE